MGKLTALRIFRRVAELNGFVTAAEDLGYSNAAVSKNIRALEAELGARLLNRTTRRVSLTEAGREYYNRISGVLDSLADADRLLADLGHSPRGRLRVNAPMSLGIALLAPAIHQFLMSYPDISIDLVLNDARVDMLAENFDVSIRGGGPLHASSLIGRKLANLPRVLCASPRYLKTAPPLTHPDQLAEHECLIYSLASEPTHWRLQNNGELATVDVNGRCEINNSIALREAAVAGLGIALLPRYLANDQLEAGTLEPVLVAWQPETHSIHAIYPSHREHSRTLRVFLDFIVEMFGSGLRS